MMLILILMSVSIQLATITKAVFIKGNGRLTFTILPVLKSETSDLQIHKICEMENLILADIFTSSLDNQYVLDNKD